MLLPVVSMTGRNFRFRMGHMAAEEKTPFNITLDQTSCFVTGFAFAKPAPIANRDFGPHLAGQLCVLPVEKPEFEKDIALSLVHGGGIIRSGRFRSPGAAPLVTAIRLYWSGDCSNSHGCAGERWSVPGKLSDVVDDAEELPLSVHLAATAYGEAIHAQCGSSVPEYRLHDAHSF